MSDNTQQATTGKQFAAVERPKNRKLFNGFGGGAGRALPRPQRGGGGGNMLRLIAMSAAVVIVLGNSTSTEITAQLVSSAILWGAVGYVITWVAQYAFDASWEGNWGLFIARVTMPLIALAVFSTIGLSIATRAASRIATVTASAPPVQSASQLAGGLVRILGGVTQAAAATAASWGGEASWGEYASGVQTMTVGGIVEGLSNELVVGGNGGAYAATAMNPAAEAAAPETQAETKTVEASAAPAPQIVSDRPGEYVVARGDSLSTIAKNVYGDADLWVILCNANSATLGGNCNTIKSGQRLVIPDKNTAPRTIPARINPNSGVQNVVATTRQNGQAFTAQGQQYLNALDAAQRSALAEQQAVIAATPTPRPTLVLFTQVPYATPEFATNNWLEGSTYGQYGHEAPTPTRQVYTLVTTVQD
jgi:LysM repeat protein